MSKGAHPKHPSCPECGKAMYKAAIKGTQVKKTDPWAFCRNSNCKLVGMNQTIELSEAPPPPEPKPSKRAKTSKHKADPAQAAPKPMHTKIPSSRPEDEPESVSRARFRIRELLRKALAGSDANKTTVGIVLALVSQETGNHAAANVLIDDYKLDELLGIAKQEVRGG